MESTSMFIQLWNAEVEDWEYIPVVVPNKVHHGPRCDYICISRSQVSPDHDGNFPIANYGKRERDAVHVYTSARLTIALWERAIGRKIIWPWNLDLYQSPLKIECYNELVDAVYYQRFRSIELGTTGPELRYTCRSFDIVSHEITHAIIRAINPGIYNQATIETYACVEALCDISAFLTLASQPHIFDIALTRTEGDLMRKNFLSEFGEGYSKNSRDGIRSALTIQQIPDDPCALGSKLVHVVYQRMVELFNSSDSATSFDHELDRYIHHLLSSIESISHLSLHSLDITSSK